MSLSEKISPASVLDRTIRLLFRAGQVPLAEACHYHLKGRASGQLIQWARPSGVKLWLNPKNYIDRIVLRGGEHDPEIIDAFTREARPGDVFWDVGANIGLMGLLLSERILDLRVVAFEPSPLAFSQLFENNLANGSRMQLLPFALSDSEKMMPLSVKVNRNSSQSTFLPQDRYNYDTSIPAFCRTGDSIVEQGIVPPPNLLKIDTEGFEYSVLRGMRKTLLRPELRAIIFEGPTPEQEFIVRLLDDSGFLEPKALTDRGQTNFLSLRA